VKKAELFEELKEKLKGKEIYRVLASELLEAVYRNFEAEGRPQKWKHLAKSTIRDRRRKGYWPGKILQRQAGGSGLLASIHSSYTDNSATVGTNKAYAAIHQFGGQINRAPGVITLRHRTDAKGNLLQTDLFGGKGLVFAKKTHKRAAERQMKRQGYVVNVPARPFLVVTEDDRAKLNNEIKEYLTRL
jgi:phage virion morphogenesis protein